MKIFHGDIPEEHVYRQPEIHSMTFCFLQSYFAYFGLFSRGLE